MNLLHLPDDIPISIVDQAFKEPTHLYQVSRLCKTLQRLFLPLYLKRIGVLVSSEPSRDRPATTTLVLLQKRMRMIPLLRSTGYFTFITGLRCTFSTLGLDA